MKIQLRNDLAAAWTAANPVLASGEFGVETDTNHFKVGDGATAWNDLDYQGSGSGLSLAQADARYLRIAQLDTPNGPPSLDASALLKQGQLPQPSPNLVLLFENALA